jgi:hypothetical protein
MPGSLGYEQKDADTFASWVSGILAFISAHGFYNVIKNYYFFSF